MQHLRNPITSLALLFETPVAAGVFSFLVYTILAAQRAPVTGTSIAPYFNYLADAFLHGQLHLRLIPATQHDLDLHNGRYYIYWPPFPAILLMPFVALFGVGFSDILFTLALGALNVGLVAYCLRLVDQNRLIPTTSFQRGILVLSFAFGTVHMLLAPLGMVWFTSQIVAFLFGTLAFVAALRLKGFPAFFLTGVAIACAFLTRTHLILLGIWPAYYLFQNHKSAGWRRLSAYFSSAALPIMIAMISYGLYNYLRFGNALENGVSYQNIGAFFQPDLQKYGLVNLHYLWTNLYYEFIFYPFPLSLESFMGGSLFLLSPLFFAAFLALCPSPSGTAKVLWLTAIAVLIPILLTIGTGWLTFGPRYTLDLTLPLLLLTAIGIRSWPKWLLMVLTTVAIAHYIIGVLYFIRAT
jgi:hypothetical protein